MKTTLIVTHRREGFHSWPEAPLSRSYLRERHRHVFHYRAELSFDHEIDRDVEFHDLLGRLKRWSKAGSHVLAEDVCEFGHSSCEQMALYVAGRLHGEYYLPVAVEVWEDGECGARVELP